jgi:putative glutathione S-transferase
MEKQEIKSYRHTVSKDHDTFQPESGRYHLYVGLFCPYAHRAYLALHLKGLQDHIGVSVVHPVKVLTKPGVDDIMGYGFKDPSDPATIAVGGYSCSGSTLDSANGAKTLREIYDLSDENYSGPHSIPILWDKKTKKIVNNDSEQVSRILNGSFNDLAKNPELDLYPEPLRRDIDEMNNLIQAGFMANCFKAGFTNDQKTYEEGFNDTFATLDKLEEILKTKKYIAGNQFTESDIRLFVGLIRFDEAMAVIFKLNKKKIVQYENLINHTREIYQMDGVAPTVNLEHVRVCFGFNYKEVNPSGLIPLNIGFEEELKKPHNRK